jgi:hypothetical protein
MVKGRASPGQMLEQLILLIMITIRYDPCANNRPYRGTNTATRTYRYLFVICSSYIMLMRSVSCCYVNTENNFKAALLLTKRVPTQCYAWAGMRNTGLTHDLFNAAAEERISSASVQSESSSDVLKLSLLDCHSHTGRRPLNPRHHCQLSRCQSSARTSENFASIRGQS